jgi:hypothetical protein
MTTNIPNGHKHTYFAKKYTNYPQIHQYFPFMGSPKFTQIGISGMKIYHLATLSDGRIDAASAY